MKSGPLGGDQQIGAMIAENRLDLLVFFMDPLSAQPHEADVQAVVRLATLYNVVLATNTAAADFIISSPLFAQAYEPADGAPDRITSNESCPNRLTFLQTDCERGMPWGGC